MNTCVRPRTCLALLLLVSAMTAGGQTPPKHTSTLGTAKSILPSQLKPGEYAWRPELSPKGPIVLIVSLPVEQRSGDVYSVIRRDHRRVHRLDRKERP